MQDQVGVQVRGDAPATVAADARARIAAALAHLGTQVAQLWVRLSDTAAQLPGRVLAQATALAEGRRVRVQVAAPGYGQAIEALIGRLRERIEEATVPWSPRAWPAREDSGLPALDQTPQAPRGGGWIVRVKPYTLTWCDVAVAVATMDLMDYRAHLFTDPECEMDAVVYRAGPTGYRLKRLRPMAPPHPGPVPLTLDPRPAPILYRDQAVASLDRTGLAHLFFQDAASDRGSLLYRRFDGHYALIAGAA